MIYITNKSIENIPSTIRGIPIPVIPACDANLFVPDCSGTIPSVARALSSGISLAPPVPFVL